MNYQKINIPQYIIPVFILFFNAIMIIFAKEIFSGAQSGLKMWIEAVIPSLLPFMISIGLMLKTGTAQAFGKLLQPFFLKVFNLTGTQAFIFIVGIAAGCPVGMKTLAQLYRNGCLSRHHAHRMMLFCNNTGMMFILSTAGAGFFGSIAIGRALLLCSLLSAATAAFLSGLAVKKQPAESNDIFFAPLCQRAVSQVIDDSLHSILTVGAYIIIFSVIGKIFGILHIYDGLAALLTPLGLDKNLSRAAAIGIFEVTNGCRAAAGTSKAAFTAAAAIIGWGGLSIHAQSIAFLDDTDLSCLPYLAGKCLNAALCALYALPLYGTI